MFITSRLSPAELVAHFFDLRGVTETETQAFRELRHNKDLCPRFRRNVDALLTSYSAYHADVHDIQSMSDEGVDVLLRCTMEGSSAWRIGLQVKSYPEFEDWVAKRGSSMTEKLVAQHSRATHNAKVDDYYIVLCTDANEHRGQIRQIVSTFKNYASVRVIIPQKALAFYQMWEDLISIEVTRLLCADDLLLTAARDEMQRLEDAEAYLLIHLACSALAGDEIGRDDISRMFSDWKELQENEDGKDRDMLVNFINGFEEQNILDVIDEDYSVRIQNLPASLCALYFDLKHRHEIRDMAEHLCSLLGVGLGEERDPIIEEPS